ncbi:hypothetical protein [Crocinitomix catalasitica]|nr:hypothetical protein [Crocinitomix catalasitica]
MKTDLTNNRSELTKLVRAEKIAWIIFLGLGLNYIILAILLSL